MEEEFLTTVDVARIMGVGTTSVKRWADHNQLECVRTAGGHRRFRREAVERFLREQGGVLQATLPKVEWVDLMLSSGHFTLLGEMLKARDRLGSWFEVAEELGAGLHELGLRWQRGEIRVVDEHVASEKVARAIERVLDLLPNSTEDPVCLLVTVEQEEHTLGLSLAEITLREAGWNCRWAGRNTPLEDLENLVAHGEVEMVGISASVASSNAVALDRVAQRLGLVCREHRVHLVLGGLGHWPPKPRYGHRVVTLRELHRLALELRTMLAGRG